MFDYLNKALIKAGYAVKDKTDPDGIWVTEEFVNALKDFAAGLENEPDEEIPADYYGFLCRSDLSLLTETQRNCIRLQAQLAKSVDTAAVTFQVDLSELEQSGVSLNNEMRSALFDLLMDGKISSIGKNAGWYSYSIKERNK